MALFSASLPGPERPAVLADARCQDHRIEQGDRCGDDADGPRERAGEAGTGEEHDLDGLADPHTINERTRHDVAGAIIDYIAGQVGFPEIDVRQRLSVSTGYGVAEIVVHSDADLVGKRLADSMLSDLDITVLTVHRGTAVIPNPKRDVVLEANDRLLCFGKLEDMRSMVPERRRRRARVRKLPKEPIPEG